MPTSRWTGTLALPGLSMAEWGPGDHSYWLYGLDVMPEDGITRRRTSWTMPEMVKVRQKVLDLCKKNKVMFLNAANTDKNSLGLYRQADHRMARWCWNAARMPRSSAANTPSGKCLFEESEKCKPDGRSAV